MITPLQRARLYYYDAMIARVELDIETLPKIYADFVAAGNERGYWKWMEGLSHGE